MALRFLGKIWRMVLCRRKRGTKARLLIGAVYNWTLFIQSVLSSVKIELLPDEEVVVYGIPYLQNLEDIIDVYSSR